MDSQGIRHKPVKEYVVAKRFYGNRDNARVQSETEIGRHMYTHAEKLGVGIDKFKKKEKKDKDTEASYTGHK